MMANLLRMRLWLGSRWVISIGGGIGGAKGLNRGFWAASVGVVVETVEGVGGTGAGAGCGAFGLLARAGEKRS